MSDEGSAANDAASDGSDGQDDGSAPTSVATRPVARPQRPTGKRSRVQVAASEADDAELSDDGSGDTSSEDAAEKPAKAGGKSGKKTPKRKKAGSGKTRPANPFMFVYNYLKQVVVEMRKVIWPSRKQMVTYTSVVLAFLVFMVALVGLADFGLTKLVLWVFGHG